MLGEKAGYSSGLFFFCFALRLRRATKGGLTRGASKVSPSHGGSVSGTTKRMRHLTHISLGILLLFSFACKVLFWQDARSWAGGRWAGDSVFYEIELHFQTKAHWFALNQNAITRNYETVLLKHRVAGDGAVPRPLARYRGWTLENSLYHLGNRLIAIRGTTDVLGGADRELVSVDLTDPEGRGAPAPMVLQRPERLLLAALPAPGGEQLALVTTTATMSKATGEVFVDLYRLGPDGLSGRRSARVEWSGAPGMPNIAWAADGSRFYVNRNKDVVEVAAGTGAVSGSHLFPKCWLQSTSNVSDAGRAFFRTDPEGTIEIRKTEGWIPPSRIPLTGNISKIGEGCP